MKLVEVILWFGIYLEFHKVLVLALLTLYKINPSKQQTVPALTFWREQLQQELPQLLLPGKINDSNNCLSSDFRKRNCPIITLKISWSINCPTRLLKKKTVEETAVPRYQAFWERQFEQELPQVWLMRERPPLVNLKLSCWIRSRVNPEVKHMIY